MSDIVFLFDEHIKLLKKLRYDIRYFLMEISLIIYRDVEENFFRGK